MSRPSRSRKSVNYSDFMDGDDDEDFATARAPPNKKPRASVKDLHQETTVETGPSGVMSGHKRVSVDEKLYKRDLEAALSLSLLQRTETEELTDGPVEEDQPPVLTHCDVASSVRPPQDGPPVLSNCSVDIKHLDLDAVGSCTDSESDADFSDPDESEDEEYTVKKKIEKKKTSRKEKKPMTNAITKKSTPKLPKGKPQSTARKKVLSPSPGVAQSVPVLKKTPITPPTAKPALYSSPPAARLPKWNPPGMVGSSPSSCQSAQVKSPGLGLRIGLSRLARIKPLHPNAAAL